MAKLAFKSVFISLLLLGVIYPAATLLCDRGKPSPSVSVHNQGNTPANRQKGAEILEEMLSYKLRNTANLLFHQVPRRHLLPNLQKKCPENLLSPTKRFLTSRPLSLQAYPQGFWNYEYILTYIKRTVSKQKVHVEKVRTYYPRATFPGEWNPRNYQECAGMENEALQKCKLYVKQQGRGMLLLCMILVTAGVSGSLLIVWLYVNRLRYRRRSLFVVRQAKPVMVQTAEHTVPICNPGCDIEDRCADPNMPVMEVEEVPQEDGVIDRDMPCNLDGAGEGWMKRILYKRGTVPQHPRTYSPTPGSRPPRLPTLRLPKPTLATVRKASGLAPGTERFSNHGNGKFARGAGRVKWGSTI